MSVRAMDLGGRVALVTGAAGGLGAAHALALARRGACVVAADMLDSSSVVETIVRRGGEAAGVAVDLATPQGCATALSAALELYGEVDILVNNAGVVRDRMSFNLSQDDWEVVLAVNLSASFFLAQGLIRCWRALPSGRDRVIVNTSSESGLHGNAGQANYAAAKAGVAALTVTLASELARYGIRVNAIAPRARTPMSAAAFGGLPRTPEFDPFATEHVAEVVAWLASDAARDVTGQVLVVHGAGVEVMRPWTAIRRVARGRPWTDDDLLKLRGELFPDGATRHLARPVGDLFVSPEAKESTSHAR